MPHFAALSLGKRPGTHCMGVWVDPRAGVNGCRKFLPPLGFNPQTIEPIASQYSSVLDENM
jgi:hypothetical protein